jgi:hypothetical protein
LRYARIIWGFAGLAAFCLVALSAMDGKAGMVSPGGAAAQHEPLVTPVKVWRECQEIALCTGCKPRYKCRSCEYKRTCTRGLCSWNDVCAWSPFMKVLPRGARIIRLR